MLPLKLSRRCARLGGGGGGGGRAVHDDGDGDELAAALAMSMMMQPDGTDTSGTSLDDATVAELVSWGFEESAVRVATSRLR